jgi:hypothetical protein
MIHVFLTTYKHTQFKVKKKNRQEGNVNIDHISIAVFPFWKYNDNYKY